uniref:peptidyl-tRNA hydrolase n=1 Tax=Kalanchoe fedtschenkoi TaxID=63787 RepID=A0A7N0TZM0_KALFE
MNFGGLSTAASIRIPSLHRCIQFSAYPFNSASHTPYPSPRNLLRMPPSSAAAAASMTTASSSSDSLETADVKKQSHPWLIVGLGNPGKTYSGTRHNVGFELVDALAESEGISMGSVSFKALFGKGFIGNVPVMLAKPQTFMNLSGQSVYDDMDLPFAKLRMLPKGGHGGHNGMRSIIDHVKGNRDFPRLRIGIGRPPGKMDGASYVMRPFSKQERQELDFTLQAGVEAVRILLLEGFDKSASYANSPKSLEQLG